MDMHSLSAFTRHLLEVIAAATPGSDVADDKMTAASELLASFNPTDPAAAQLAALAIATAEAAMDGFVRAARPDLSDETAMRLRTNAVAAARMYATMFRTLRPSHSPKAGEGPAKSATRRVAVKRALAKPAVEDASPDIPPAAPADAAPAIPPSHGALAADAQSIPAADLFQPNDRFGKPIPRWREDLMTSAQFRAAFASPRDPELEAVARAEEAAMQAEQQAQDSAADSGGTAKADD